MAPRRLALDLLARIEDDGAWANLVVPRALDRCDLGDADRRLVTELTYGTVRADGYTQDRASTWVTDEIGRASCRERVFRT